MELKNIKKENMSAMVKLIGKVAMKIIVIMWYDWKEYFFIEDVTFRYENV